MLIKYICEHCMTHMETHLTDLDIVSFHCNNKECNNYDTEVKIRLSSYKFSTLYDMGIIAMKNGYFREAVADFASSFERFLEFFIKCCEINSNFTYEQVNKHWTEINRQSERQYGYFLSTLNTFFPDNPFVLNTDMSGFRNKIIHNGYLPSYDEVYQYAQYVYNNISSLLYLIIENGFEEKYSRYLHNTDYYATETISFINVFSYYENNSKGNPVRNEYPSFAESFDKFDNTMELVAG